MDNIVLLHTEQTHVKTLNTVVYSCQPSKPYWSSRRWLTVTFQVLPLFAKDKKNDPYSTLWICSITSVGLSMRCSTRTRTPGRPPITIRHLNAWPNGPAARTPGTQRATLSVYSDAAVLITSLPADKQSDLQKKAAVEILLPYLSPGRLIPYCYHYINELILLRGSTNVLV